MKSIAKYALCKNTRVLKHVDTVKNGIMSETICPECFLSMMAVQGPTNEHHFRHVVESDCAGGSESWLHLKAKQFIVEGSAIQLAHGKFAYTDAKAEKKLERFRPDLTIKIEGVAHYIEIVVSNKVSEEKKAFLKSHKYSYTVIDLSHIALGISMDELRDIVMYQTVGKTFIDNTEKVPFQEQLSFESYDEPWWNLKMRLFFAMIIFVVLIFLFKGVRLPKLAVRGTSGSQSRRRFKSQFWA